MLTVNMFGAPGAGKSTTAAGLFHLLKVAGKSVEYVPENAKWFTYEERHKTLGYQAYIHGKQLRDLLRLDGKVELAITDSPTLLSVIYGKTERPSFYHYVIDQFKSMPCINFLIERVKPYSSLGRSQTEIESDVIGGNIKTLLCSLDIPHIIIPGDSTSPRVAMKHVEEHLLKV